MNLKVMELMYHAYVKAAAHTKNEKDMHRIHELTLAFIFDTILNDCYRTLRDAGEEQAAALLESRFNPEADGDLSNTGVAKLFANGMDAEQIRELLITKHGKMIMEAVGRVQ